MACVIRTIIGWMRAVTNRVDFALMDLEARLGPDNYDMPADQVRELVIAKCPRGMQFYPSDLAFEYGLDYDVVVKVVDQMRREGLVR